MEARDKIVAQLQELEFRVTGNVGAWRRRGPRDRGDIYDALKCELDEIDQLLGAADKEEGHDRSESKKFETATEPLEWPLTQPGVNTRIWAAIEICLLVIALGVGVAYALR